MKKVLLSVLLFYAFFSFEMSAEKKSSEDLTKNSRALGLKLGYGFDIAYQHWLGAENMLSVDLSFSDFKALDVVVVTKDWIYPVTSWENAGEVNCYLGYGGAAGFGFHNDLTLGVAGRAGIEYIFEKVPISVSFDYRPVLGPTFDLNNNGKMSFSSDRLSSAGFSIKYMF